MAKESLNLFKRIDIVLLAGILLIAGALRLYRINVPLADYHSWRQADTAAVARNFVRDGFDLMHPRYDDLSNIQSGMENPQGYRFVEFPLYNATFGFLYKILPAQPLEVYGRVVSLISSLIVIAVLYYFARKEEGRVAALTASLVYAVFPFFVFFSRVVLPESNALAYTFLSLFFLYRFTQTTGRARELVWFSLSIVAFAAGVLIKPTVVFYGVSAAYLFLRKYGWGVLRRLYPYLFFALSAAPFLLWRQYIQTFPEGIPVSAWLLTSVNTGGGPQTIFFRPAFFRWVFLERINLLMLGGFMSVFFLLGVLLKPKRYFSYSILISALLFLFVFQGGNVQHEYYQVIIFPAVALMTGIGVQYVVSQRKAFLPPLISWSVMAVFFALSLYFSYYRVRDFYNYPPELKRIAEVISAVTSSDDKIITDRVGDTTLLYLADRRGAPAPFKDFELLKKDGYTYFVTFQTDVITNMRKENTYQVVAEGKIKDTEFAIFKL